MRVIVEVNEERIGDIKTLLTKNNFDFEITNDLSLDQESEIPKWQKEEVERRIELAEKNPEMLLPLKDVIQELESKYR